MDRHIEVEGGFNVRELGGYPTSDGRVTKSGVLIRSGNLDKISPTGQQKLIDYGVKTVVDLRDEWEVKEFPNVFAESTTVKYIHLPLISSKLSDEIRPQTDTFATLHEIYSTHLERCQPEIGMIVSTIAESESATIFHCYAGKDRTGMIAGLILSAVGVDDSVIAEDYAETKVHIPHLVAEWREHALKAGQELWRFERNSGAEYDTMIGLLNSIQTRYGGTIPYLKAGGVTDAQLESLRKRFI